MRQEDGSITATCQFCSRTYRFDKDAIESLRHETLH